MIKTVFDLEVFQLAYNFAMDVFKISKNFPREERYSLTDQFVRSSRSVAANIAEGWGKRNYENEFKRHLIYAIGSLEETKVWLLFARDCEYINKEHYDVLCLKYDEIGAKIHRLYQNWKKY
jgi:four helix bundle protein